MDRDNQVIMDGRRGAIFAPCPLPCAQRIATPLVLNTFEDMLLVGKPRQ